MKGFHLALSAYGLGYFAFLIIYFLFFGFSITTFFGFLMTLIISLMIGIFLLIFLSPTYCNQETETSNAGLYLEILIYGLLVYIVYFYLANYVMPFYQQSGLVNRIKHDFIFGAVIIGLFGIITLMNYYISSAVLGQINFYTFIAYLFILSMKIYIIWQQSMFSSNSTNPSIGQQGGWKNILIREPDYLEPNNYLGSYKKKIKSSFYNLS
jgi:hypothetical protein